MNCIECKHRGSVPGSCHSSCNHPTVANNDPMLSMFAIFASVHRCDPIVSPASIDLGVKLNPHGVKNGWANFPWDFDSIWVDACNGFEKIDND